MLTWMGMRHHRVKDATSEELVVPPGAGRPHTPAEAAAVLLSST